MRLCCGVRTVYLDYNATTPLDAAVREAMTPALEGAFGNPSSVHHVGQRARRMLDESRERVADVFGCKPSEVLFTSGATESVNLAVLGAARSLRAKGRHIVSSEMEHAAVLEACEYLAKNEGFSLSLVAPDSSGLISVDSVAAALRPDTILVSIVGANNEVGTIQPVSEIGALCSQRGICFHVDAAQWLGKLPFSSIHQFHADLVSFCAHKFHGPKGAGGLFVRSPLQISPILYGGSHEYERRAGTENLPAILGLAKAVDLFVRDPVFNPALLSPMADHLLRLVDSIPATTFRGHRTARLPNTVSFTVAGADSISLLAGLDLEGICASSGSACSSGSITPSRVVSAMGASLEESHSLVRFSIGRENAPSDIDTVHNSLPHIIARALSAHKVWTGVSTSVHGP